MTYEEIAELLQPAFNSALDKHVVFLDTGDMSNISKYAPGAEGFTMLYLLDAYAKLPGTDVCFDSQNIFFIGTEHLTSDDLVNPMAPVYQLLISEESTQDLVDNYFGVLAKQARAEQDEPCLYEALDRAVKGGWTPQLAIAPMQKEDGMAVNLGELLLSLAVQDAIEAGHDDMAALLAGITIEGAQEKRETLPPLNSVKPRTRYWPNAKDSNVLTDPLLFEEGGLTLDVSRGRKGKVFTQLELFAPEGHDGEKPSITFYDRDLISLIASIRQESEKVTGQPVVSLSRVCELLYKNKKPETLAEVEAQMDALIVIPYRQDVTEEARARKLINPETGRPFTDKVIITGPLIPGIKFEGVDDRGNRTVRYRLYADPPTYEHAKLVGQVITWDENLYDLKPIREDGTLYKRSNTKRQQAIKSALLARVFSLKNKRSNISGTIIYDNLCREVEVDPAKRDARKNLVDFVEAYLRALAKAGVIVDFQPRVVGSQHKRISVDVFV